MHELGSLSCRSVSLGRSRPAVRVFPPRSGAWNGVLATKTGPIWHKRTSGTSSRFAIGNSIGENVSYTSSHAHLFLFISSTSLTIREDNYPTEQRIKPSKVPQKPMLTERDLSRRSVSVPNLSSSANVDMRFLCIKPARTPKYDNVRASAAPTIRVTEKAC